MGRGSRVRRLVKTVDPNPGNAHWHLRVLWAAFAVLALMCPQLPIRAVFTAVTGIALPSVSACTDPSCAAQTPTPAPPAESSPTPTPGA